MTNSYRDKVAVVTGGAGGIGGALCQALADRGAVVVVADIDESAAGRLASTIAQTGGRVVVHRVDVGREAAVQSLIDETVARHGRLDYMFNAAGVAVIGELRDITADHWQPILDVTLRGVVHGTMCAYRTMVAQGHGQIVNIASLAGLIPFPTAVPYAAAKHAIVGLTSSLRLAAAAFGVGVSLVCPGFVDTGLFDAAPVLRSKREHLLTWLPFKKMDPNGAARVILAGVERNRAMIVFPMHARTLWRLSRIHGALITPVMNKAVRRFRRSRIEP